MTSLLSSIQGPLHIDCFASVSSLSPRHLATPSGISPRGSRFPIFEDSGSRYHIFNMVFVTKKPQILGAWTLWFRQANLLYATQHVSCFVGFARNAVPETESPNSL